MEQVQSIWWDVIYCSLRTKNTLTLHSEQRWPHGWWTVHYINLGCMYSWRQWFPWQEAASASVVDFLPSVSWKIAQSFFGRSLQDIRVFKRDHFATSLTFSWTAAESRVTGSLVKECNLYVQIFCMFLYVLLNVIKKLSFLKFPYICPLSNFYKTHVSVGF